MEFMYVNQHNKLDYRHRLRIAKYLNRYRSATWIADYFHVSRTTVYQIKTKLRVGLGALEDHKPGPLSQPLNPLFYAYIKDLRVKNGWGAQKIEVFYRKKGFSVSHNKINTVIKFEKLTRKKMGKRMKPIYVAYEAEHNNDMWHMDWSTDPLSKKKLIKQNMNG